jgi:hypothetical protein
MPNCISQLTIFFSQGRSWLESSRATVFTTAVVRPLVAFFGETREKLAHASAKEEKNDSQKILMKCDESLHECSRLGQVV